ncbi:MAG TPA: DUF2442 domain-containing protein [Candidatus Saccharimonadales bacterium]|nr:DUF2442 domain-containing protein [Candidatus Saccharimonadales bacterium]
MNTLTDRACSAAHVDGWIVVRMESAVEVHFPVAENPPLSGGTPQHLRHIEISPLGLHWPDLDEALSFHGLLEGNHGQLQKKLKI